MIAQLRAFEHSGFGFLSSFVIQRLMQIRFMVPMHAKKRKRALHEPYDALLANEQVIHPGFMVPMHSKKRKGALHEPPFRPRRRSRPRPRPGGLASRTRTTSTWTKHFMVLAS